MTTYAARARNALRQLDDRRMRVQASTRRAVEGLAKKNDAKLAQSDKNFVRRLEARLANASRPTTAGAKRRTPSPSPPPNQPASPVRRDNRSKRPRTETPNQPALHSKRIDMGRHLKITSQNSWTLPPLSPDKIFIDGAAMYAFGRFDNGTPIHLFGEIHTHYRTCTMCRLPRCMHLVQYVEALMSQAKRTSRMLDIFIEYGRCKREPEEATCPLRGLRNLIGNTSNNEDRVVQESLRVHKTDVRKDMLFPPVSLGRRVQRPKLTMHIVDAILNSDTYSKNASEFVHSGSSSDYRRRFPKNATTYPGHKDVSRVRKALLKLPPDIAAKLRRRAGEIALFANASMTNRDMADLTMASTIMDVYTVARMLYYAGYVRPGTPPPMPGFSKTQFAHGGANHTRRWISLLESTGVVTVTNIQTHGAVAKWPNQQFQCVQAFKPYI